MLRRPSRRRHGGADRRMPKSGSREPEGQPAEWQPRSGRRQNQPTERQLRSGACRKAEVVSPKANPTRAIPKRCVPKSGSHEPEGQLAERQLRSGACRKAEVVSPKGNPPSGKRRNGRQRRAAKTTGAPSGESRRSKPRNEGSAEQCRHTYQYNRKTRL